MSLRCTSVAVGNEGSWSSNACRAPGREAPWAARGPTAGLSARGRAEGVRRLGQREGVSLMSERHAKVRVLTLPPHYRSVLAAGHVFSCADDKTPAEFTRRPFCCCPAQVLAAEATRGWGAWLPLEHDLLCQVPSGTSFGLSCTSHLFSTFLPLHSRAFTCVCQSRPESFTSRSPASKAVVVLYSTPCTNCRCV